MLHSDQKKLIVRDVYLEIKFPKSDNDEVYINCFPTNEQLKIILDKRIFNITGEAYDEFNLYDKITIKEAIFHEILPRRITKDEESYLVVFTCMDLCAEFERKHSEADKIIEGWFYISLLASLSPAKTLNCKPSGDVEVLPYTTHKFNLDENFIISLDTKYIYDSANKSFSNQLATVSYSKDVAEFNFQGEFTKIPYYSNLLDDFLMLMSFAIRKRTVCTGWIANNNRKHMKFIRRDIVIPKYNDENLLPGYLVEPSELANFLQKSFPKLQNFDNVDIIERAINPLPSNIETSTESYFLILFSCLESVLLFHKKNKNLETIITESDFHIISSRLKKNIEDYLVNSNNEELSNRETEILKNYDDSKISMLSEKISELNRPSFRRILDDFCSNYLLSLEDLWPVTGSNHGINLSKIRNKLIHGDTFKASQHYSLIIAGQHLQTIVERVILKVLDWDIEKTRAAPSKIKNNLLMKEAIEKHMKILSK